MLIRSTVKGQIVIPVALRKKYGITEKTPIYVYETDGKIILEPITPEYIHKVRGMFKDLPLMESIKQMRTEDELKVEQRLQQWLKTESSTPQR
jgi:AbrB family looped-hinge helix DNA binding protein